MRLALSLPVFALAASNLVFGQLQNPVPPLVARAEVRLVNVDVTVTDSEGRPVSGLTRDDFEVFEDGVLQPITGFYAVEDAAVRLQNPASSASSPGDFRRKFILMIDNNTVQKPHRDAAIEFVSRFLDNDPPEASEWAVMTVGSQVETLQPFTTDKEAIRTALLKARRAPVFVQQREIDRDLLSDPARAQLRQRGHEAGYSTARFQSKEQSKRNLVATINTAKAIIQTARAFTAAPGKKSLILLTGGIEMNTAFGVAKEQEDPDLVEIRRQLEQMLETISREANAANIKIHVVKAGGHQNQAPQHDVEQRTAGLQGGNRRPFFGEGYTTTIDSSNVDSSSLTLALKTGGRYFPADVRQSLERIETESANFYSIAFKPRAPEDAKYHTLKVRVKRPDLTVHHRSGYVALSQDQRLELALRSPLTFEKEKGDLPVTLQVGAAEKADGEKRLVPLTAAIPVESLSLLGRGDQKVGRLHVYLAIYDETGKNVGYHHRIQNVSVPATAETPKPVTHSLKVALPKGRYTVAVTLRDEISNEIGTALKDVRI